MGKLSVGIDLGGTRIKSVVLDPSGSLVRQQYIPTRDGDGAQWKQAISSAVEGFKAQLGTNDFDLGISAPGLPNAENSAIAHMPGRLHGLENFDWSFHLRRRTWVLNDALSALVAESKLGAATDKKNAVLLTLGTGVGGAILIDGKPYQGSFQKAGHIGHMSLDSEGEPDVTGMPGSLEDAIGNGTIMKRSMGRFASTHALLDAYRQGDPFAKQTWLTSIKKLAVALASLANILSPECIILAGGITEAGEDLFEPLHQFMAMYEWRAGGFQTSILKSQFGDLAGAIGAACFAGSQGNGTKMEMP